MLYRFISILLFLIPLSGILIFFSCDETKMISKKEIDVMNKCIAEMRSNPIFSETCYIVNPYFNSLSLSKNDEKRKEELLKEVGLNKNMFIDHDKSMLKRYNELLGLSSCNRSNFIFSFSEIEDNYILVKLEIKYYELRVDQIDKIQEFENNQWEFRIFKIENDNSIKEIGNTIVYKN